MVCALNTTIHSRFIQVVLTTNFAVYFISLFITIECIRWIDGQLIMLLMTVMQAFIASLVLHCSMIRSNRELESYWFSEDRSDL